MQLSGEAVHWLVANGALGRSIKASNDKKLVRLNILDSDCVENGHALHRLLSVMSKRLGVSLGIIPDLGCTEDEYCSPAIRKFNWDILGQLLSSFGFILDEDGKDLIVAGDTEILRQTLEEIQTFLDNLSAQQNGDNKQVGYSYFYQPKPLPLANAAPTSPELALNRCSSVPSKEPPQWTDDASSDKPTSQPAGEKPSWTNRQKQLIEDLQNKRRNKKLLEEEEELLKAKAKERQKKALRQKVERNLKVQKKEREERKKKLEEVGDESPMSCVAVAAPKPKKQNRQQGKRTAIRTAIPNKIGLLICQTIIDEIITEVSSGAAKHRLTEKMKLREQQKRIIKERRQEEHELASNYTTPSKEAEQLKKHNRSNVLLIKNIINDILNSIATGEAQKRLRRRKEEVKRAKQLRHREVLIQAEKLPEGVSAVEEHKKRIAEEREMQKKRELQEHNKKDKQRQARQNQMKKQLELERERKADEANKIREKEAAERDNADKKMRLLKLKRQKEEDKKKQEIDEFHQRKQEDEKFNKLSDDRRKEREQDEKKKAENREKRMKKKLAEWKAKENTRRELEEEETRQLELKKKKEASAPPVKPKSIKPKITKLAEDSSKAESILNDIDLPTLSPVSGLPSELKGISRGERLLSCVENRILEFIIEARREPSQCVELLHNRMQCFITHNTLRIPVNDDSKFIIKTKEGVEGCEEAVEYLNNTRGLRQPIKEVSVGLTMAARQHAADLAAREVNVIDTATGADGSTLTERLKRYGKYDMRCQEAIYLSFNSYAGLLPAEVVLADMICCDGDRLRSNRKSLFDSNNKVLGIGHAISRKYSKNRDRIITVDCVVVIFTSGFHCKPNSAILSSFNQSLESVAPDYLTSEQHKVRIISPDSHLKSDYASEGDVTIHVASPSPDVSVSDTHADTIPLGSPVVNSSHRENYPPEQNTTDQNTPDEETLDQNTPDQDTLDQNTPDQDTLDQDTLDQNTPEQETLDQNTPDQETLEDDHCEAISQQEENTEHEATATNNNTNNTIPQVPEREELVFQNERDETEISKSDSLASAEDENQKHELETKEELNTQHDDKVAAQDSILDEDEDEDEETEERSHQSEDATPAAKSSEEINNIEADENQLKENEDQPAEPQETSKPDTQPDTQLEGGGEDVEGIPSDEEQTSAEPEDDKQPPQSEEKDSQDVQQVIESDKQNSETQLEEELISQSEQSEIKHDTNSEDKHSLSGETTDRLEADVETTPTNNKQDNENSTPAHDDSEDSPTDSKKEDEVFKPEDKHQDSDDVIQHHEDSESINEQVDDDTNKAPEEEYQTKGEDESERNEIPAENESVLDNDVEGEPQTQEREQQEVEMIGSQKKESGDEQGEQSPQQEAEPPQEGEDVKTPQQQKDEQPEEGEPPQQQEIEPQLKGDEEVSEGEQPGEPPQQQGGDVENLEESHQQKTEPLQEGEDMETLQQRESEQSDEGEPPLQKGESEDTTEVAKPANEINDEQNLPKDEESDGAVDQPERQTDEDGKDALPTPDEGNQSIDEQKDSSEVPQQDN